MDFTFYSFAVPPKLNLDLGSSVSSVSDPDLSGMSDKEPAKKDSQQKAGKPDKPVKPTDGSQSEGKNKFVNAFCFRSALAQRGESHVTQARDDLTLIGQSTSRAESVTFMELSKDKTKTKTLLVL